MISKTIREKQKNWLGNEQTMDYNIALLSLEDIRRFLLMEFNVGIVESGNSRGISELQL